MDSFKIRSQLGLSRTDELIYTSFYFYCSLQYISRQIAAQSITPHIYNFQSDRGRGTPIVDSGTRFCASDKHICHAKDIIPVFGSGAIAPSTFQTGEDARFARQIIDRWTTFAKTEPGSRA
ncbi:hypothetical protein KI688_011099 [Linnemannia hyalina]|uniref:Carboxylesterase type B domain-containing protein n=1 Tax=Linnemannia hyalina TaxID=64524 RepID=A0A9P8BV20_9FUNG|nr:hypothetical protein KI688_011099 [Linnemannia hyalina]